MLQQHPFFPGIAVPTLLIQASDDPLIPLAALPDTSQLSASTCSELSAKGGTFASCAADTLTGWSAGS